MIKMNEDWKGTYIKIQTLWKRDENTHRIIEGDFSKPEFNNIKLFSVSEKVDGTNTRIIFDHHPETIGTNTVTYGGKTEDAQMSANLITILQKIFTPDKFIEVFKDETENVTPSRVILFGEGYGSKIQKGSGVYSKEPKFILFDVWIDGWWLERDNVMDIAKKFNVGHVPEIGIMTIDEAINYVKSNPYSLVAEEPNTKHMEGIVARSYPLMLFRDGTPIVWKLKFKDFK